MQGEKNFKTTTTVSTLSAYINITISMKAECVKREHS